MAKKSPTLTGIKESTTKEKILKKVRNALISTPENPFKDVDFSTPVYEKLKDEPVFQFVQELKNAGGSFIYCENEDSIAENLRILMEQKKWKAISVLDEQLIAFFSKHGIAINTEAAPLDDELPGVTQCEFLVARFGSVMVSSALHSGRRMMVYPETHIVISSTSQVVSELKEALHGIRMKYNGKLPSQITVITGPSRTADIEKTLVMGAHGPRELFVFMVDNQ
ncbi:MAG: LUD domain-containing protein [bacterium]